ncbi:MAG: chemotaxis protein CheW [Acidobacteriota bacterium]
MDLAKIRKKARRPSPEKHPPAGEAPPPSAPPPPPEPPFPPPAPEAEGAEREAEEKPLPPPAAEGEGAPAPSPPQGEAPSGRGEKLLVFLLARERYAIPIHDIALIIEERPLTPVPNAPGFFVGILTLRGKIVNVIDVAARLGIRRAARQEGRKIVILDMGADHFGLLVDGIEPLAEVDLQTLEPPPEGFRPVGQEFVEGVFYRGGRAVAFLNLPLFLAFAP